MATHPKRKVRPAFRRAEVTILHDPLPISEGGFRPGSTILELEWKRMKDMHVVHSGFRVRRSDGVEEEYYYAEKQLRHQAPAKAPEAHRQAYFRCCKKRHAGLPILG